jgi:xanthine/CO dehydrogenase XdhC/CoxF family maturation factor
MIAVSVAAQLLQKVEERAAPQLQFRAASANRVIQTF